MGKLRHEVVNGKVLDHEMIWRQSWDQNPGFLGPSLLLQVPPCTDHRHTQNTNIGILLCGARAFSKSWASQPSSDFLHYQCSALSQWEQTNFQGWEQTGKLWTDCYFLIVLGLLTQIKEESSLFFFSKANEVSKWIESVLEWGGLHSWKRLFKQKCHSSALILL